MSCVRCGRPACPACLRSAAVGQQCVECIRQGNRGSRRPQTVFGGRVAAGAVVTYALLAVNVVLWLVELAYPSIADDWEVFAQAIGPSGHLQGVAQGEWYRLITAAFLPPAGLGGLGPLDLIFNMWALVLVGPALERLLGHLRFIAIYLVSALGGSVLFYLMAPVNQPALGASGAIFGLFGAWFVVARRLRLDSRQIVFLIVINLVFGFVVPHIAWQAHVGGLLAGGLLTAAYAYAPRNQRALTQLGATAAIIAILVIAVLIRDHQLAARAAGLGLS